jgi:FdhD protein
MSATHEERPVWIALNGVRCCVLSCSPHEPTALALGHLLSEGWIETRAQVHALEVAEEPGGALGVLARVDDERVDTTLMLQRHQTLHGCGVRHFLDCDAWQIPPLPQTALPRDAGALLRALFERSAADTTDGGMHAAALSDGADLLESSYDVARHCALDRAIGAAMLAGADLGTLGLVCTARVSGAMALKAVRTRLGWIASRSIATSLAHDIAAHYGLTIIERAGRQARNA